MVEDPTPGGGGQELRKQLGIMKDFLEQLDLVNASENNAFVATTVPDGLRPEIRVLFDRSRSSLFVYVPRGPRVELGLSSRFYHVDWIDPQDGKVLKAEDLDARGRITTGSGLQPRGDRNSPKSHKTTIPCAAMSETSSNCWKFSVINETGCWEHLVGRAWRTSGLAA
jgi:hypothetical protein